MRKLSNVLTLTICLLGLGCFAATESQAANLTVNTITDLPDADIADAICADANNQCSLRAAIQQVAALNDSVNTISFAAALLNQSVQLDLPLPPLNRNTTINGLGANRLTIDANGAANAFTFNGGALVVVSSLAITEAATAIRNDGANLVISNAALTNNTGGTNGGGVYNNQGTTDILFSTVDNNSVSNSGGGVFNVGGLVRIANSTVSNNFGGGFGGGVMNADGILSAVGVLISRTELTNVTISNNSAITSGGGVFNQNNLIVGNTVAVRNTIVADNQTNQNDDTGGIFISAGNNLVENVGTATGFAAVNNDILDQPPGLGNLENNGGRTNTRELLQGSAAINAGNNCVTTATPITPCPIFNPPVALENDQRNRGFVRRNGAAVDIGAYEFGVTTAAQVQIGGRVTTARGRSVSQAKITVVSPNGEIKTAFTNPFGYYSFNEVAAGETYIFSVSHKGYQFAEQAVLILSDNKAIDLVSLQ